ncbi:RDD family protein [Chitinilyticum aquatile]|uniref:RDD family protein n=1 Tax=Chitinilyticum aquatile TaxID=362520 RepID=UPI00040FAC01|nr:RDD family protein [Chitinilyticum aquatile]
MSLNPYSPPLASLTGLPAPAEQRPASRRRRFCASLINLVLSYTIIFSYAIAQALLIRISLTGVFAGVSHSQLSMAVGFIGLAFLWSTIGVQIWLMWKKNATVGKYWLGLKVCRVDGSRIAIGRYLLRELPLIALLVVPLLLQLPLLGWALYFLALAPVFRADRRTLNDLWSDTIVIREPAHA